MKKLMMMALIVTLGMSMGWAKDKKNENVKTTVFATDIHCESCSTKIMNNVPSLGKGVKDVVVNVADKTVAVTYDTDKNNDANIIKGLKSIKVEAQPLQPRPTCVMPPVTPEQAAQMNGQAPKDCCKAKAQGECDKSAEAKDCCAAKADAASAKGCCAAKTQTAEKKSCCKDK